MFKLIIGRRANADETFVTGDDTPANVRRIATKIVKDYFDPLEPQNEPIGECVTICTFSSVAIDAVESYFRAEMQDSCYDLCFIHKNGQDICIVEEHDECWLAQSSLSSTYSRGLL